MARNKQKTDEIILRQILDVIKNIGATKFRLEDLSQKTGLAPATLLQRFGSKKNILYRALALANQQLKHGLANRDIKYRSYVNEIIDIYLELAAPFITPKSVAHGLDILKLDIIEKKLRAHAKKYFSIRRDKMISLIKSAQSKQEVISKIDVKELVWNLESIWQGAIVLWALHGHGQLRTFLRKRITIYLQPILKIDN